MGVATQQCVTSPQLSLSVFFFLMQIESHCLRQKEGGGNGTKMLSRKRKVGEKKEHLLIGICVYPKSKYRQKEPLETS